MYELMVESTFDSAHALRGYEGPCENLHGHTWKVQVYINIIIIAVFIYFYTEQLNRNGLRAEFI